MWALPAAVARRRLRVFMDNRHFLYFLKTAASIGAFSCIFVHLLEKRMKDVCSYSGLCVQVRSHLEKKLNL